MNGLAGTGPLLRLALRRDRVLLPVTGLLLVAFAGGSASATRSLYTDPAGAVAAARAANASPAVVGMYGPLADPANPDSVGALKTLMLGAVLLAVLAVVLVRRHTRLEEESGRTELLGATVVGRRAPLAAAVVLASAAVVVVSLLAGLSMAAAGLGLRGSLAFGAAWAAAGLAVVGVTAVAAQVAATARGCAGLAYGALGAAYLLRAVGDTSSASWLTWLSPLGWTERMEVYGADRFVVALLGPACLVVLVAVALLERRDLGAGLVATRPGPARGAASLGSPLALAWRLQRGLLLGWLVGYAVLGLVLGAVAGSVGSFVTDDSITQMLARLGGSTSTLVDLFVSTELHFLAVGAAAYGIAAALRLRSEEGDLHTEQVLATAATRRAQLGAHALVALGGSALLMLVVGAALGATAGGQYGGVAAALAHLLPAALSPVPAVWVCVGLALAVYGALPTVVVAAWGLLAAFLVLGELGPLFALPQALVDLSPFVHGTVAPGADVDGRPLLALAAVVVALLAAALASFRRRDLVTG
ncbi:ABC transporter permease [Lapillicoccus jejuensis]|uniref:ABC-2 type transport system permease protein n=1 Tax=Lapillicoccus jejuensis TaxID=402171 RepID=A0A542E281_9MICO|nr:hypothetical protein [Lapillicoccus jejuensis]TQJ09415.1 ABC-2 type transport system permease protein [Lapillicoccus jejuensis]